MRFNEFAKLRSTKERIEKKLDELSPEKITELQEAAQSSRHGIPIIFGHDVIHGHRTVFPIPLAEACSWDPEGIEKAAELGINTGRYDGDEVVQLYITDVAASVTRPNKQLCGFKKVFVRTKETVKVSFELKKEMFEMLDRDFNKVIEPGAFVLHIGTNSDELISVMMEL